ncbi:unnamed protein product [Darwinula stevensoni]|uniref:CRAL-TRIO domain-containing protein n=1 Tax=Darwinula stevensoni TaxID=69355 RepID=A0A7R9FN12_9CRUS|nr:unnamed protein product [Darwinula stevensoni]CAG0896259.1 unnamed protein product [Darwinula stevensoni]
MPSGDGEDTYVCTLPDWLQEKAEKELNERKETRADDIKAIRHWLEKQPHLQTVPRDDRTILMFLRGCKFSLERTKEKLDMFFSIRTLLPEFFENGDPMHPTNLAILRLGTCLPVEDKYEADGSKIVIARAAVQDPDKIKQEDIIRVICFIGDIILNVDEQTQICGVTGVIDLTGMTWAHGMALTPALVKKAMTAWQDGYPARHKRLHYINAPPFFESVFNIFRGFMNEKIKRRVSFHGNRFESLHQMIPVHLLPKELGGTYGNYEDMADYWMKKVLSHREEIMERAMQKSNEKLRPGKAKSFEDVFGIEGSFRKLNVD